MVLREPTDCFIKREARRHRAGWNAESKWPEVDRKLWKPRFGPSSLHTTPGKKRGADSEENLSVVQKKEPDYPRYLTYKDQLFV